METTTENETKEAAQDEGCNCIDIVREKLEKFHGAEVDLEVKQTYNPQTMEMGVALPPLYYTWKKGKKRERSYVMYPYCPFCGKHV